MRVSERDDESILELQRLVKAYKRAGAVTEVAHVVSPVIHVVLNDHVSAADSMVVLVHYKVILNLSVLVVHLRAYDCAPIVLTSQCSLHAARVYLDRDVLTDVRAFDRRNPEYFCFVDLVLRDYDARKLAL